MKFQCARVLFILMGCLFAFAQNKDARDLKSAPVAADNIYVPVHTFDPKRDAAADIQEAIAEARKTGKRIILDVGGDWCQYCHQMDQLFQEHPELVEIRDRNFVTVAVYHGSDKKNEQTLSRYPKVEGIPHFYVLDGDGSVLHSQHLVELRKNGKYDPDKMKDFLTKWAPAAASKRHKD